MKDGGVEVSVSFSVRPDSVPSHLPEAFLRIEVEMIMTAQSDKRTNSWMASPSPGVVSLILAMIFLVHPCERSLSWGHPGHRHSETDSPLSTMSSASSSQNTLSPVLNSRRVET